MVRCRFVRLSLARTVNHSLFGSKNDRAGLRQASAYGREQQILYYYSPTESRRIGSVAAGLLRGSAERSAFGRPRVGRERVHRHVPTRREFAD